MATPEDEAIEYVVDKLWDKYDHNKSGFLTQDKLTKFLKETLAEMDIQEFSPEAYAACLHHLGKGKNYVEKKDMCAWLKGVMKEGN